MQFQAICLIVFISAVSDVFSNTIIDRDSINKFNITTCLRSNDAQNTNNDELLIVGDCKLPNIEWSKLPDSNVFSACNISSSNESLLVDGIGLSQINGIRNQLGKIFDHVKIGWTSELGEVSFHCGGTLISEKYVLSAAHCMAYERPYYRSQPDIVKIAERRLSDGNIIAEYIKITNIHTHFLYGDYNMYHDIALIELEEKSRNRPACIWISPGVPTTELFALGHDLRNVGKQQVMSLTFVNSGDCDRRYSPSRKLPSGITESQFCAGNSNITDGDKCKGHIGGPILTQLPESPDEVFVVGLTNYGQRCSSTNFPNIYTKISSYKDWIIEKVYEQ